MFVYFSGVLSGVVIAYIYISFRALQIIRKKIADLKRSEKSQW